MFKELENLGYSAYLEKYPFHIELDIDLKAYIKENGRLNKKSSERQIIHI